MMQIDPLSLGIIAIIGVAVIAAVSFSPNARLRRRRRRTHSRIVSKSNRPTVKFSVRTPDKDQP